MSTYLFTLFPIIQPISEKFNPIEKGDWLQIGEMKKVEQLLRVSTWLFYDNVVRKTAALETFTTVNFFHPTITQWEKRKSCN